MLACSLAAPVVLGPLNSCHDCDATCNRTNERAKNIEGEGMAGGDVKGDMLQPSAINKTGVRTHMGVTSAIAVLQVERSCEDASDGSAPPPGEENAGWGRTPQGHVQPEQQVALCSQHMAASGAKAWHC